VNFSSFDGIERAICDRLEGVLNNMNEEIDDEILEAELADDALEKRMRKLEAEAARILQQSSELVKSVSKEAPKQEEMTQDAAVSESMEEDKVS
jgi:F0F1-type ATP synthase membrane subunit b/b'